MDSKSIYSIEVYEKLAKLFAGENVGFVINPELPTAAFDVKNRTIYLPLWEFEHKPLYHFVIAHEIGHALYTPDSDVWKDPDLKSILNIVEDYRIDIKMKTKYPGLVSDYKKGIQWLLDHDFFGTQQKIQSKLQQISYKTFLDRLVLYLKIKANDKTSIEISFTTEEKRLVNRSILAASFDDVISVSKDILEYLKLQKENDDSPDTSKKFTQTMSPESELLDQNSEKNNQSYNQHEDYRQPNQQQPQDRPQDQPQDQPPTPQNSSTDQFGSEIQNNLEQKLSESQSKNKKIDVIKDSSCDIVKIDRIYSKKLLKEYTTEIDQWGGY